MKRMTDQEMTVLFIRHVTPGTASPHHARFTETPFYAFARELEHRAIAAGLAAQIDDPLPVIDTPARADRRDGWTARAWMLVAWLIGK